MKRYKLIYILHFVQIHYSLDITDMAKYLKKHYYEQQNDDDI